MMEEEIKKFLSENDEFNGANNAKRTVIKKIRFPNFNEQTQVKPSNNNYEFLKDVKMDIAVELGSSTVKVKELLSWNKGSIITINKLAGEAVDIYLNDKQLGIGEIIVINDSFGIRITSLESKSKG